jgi:hypothetical protein
MNETSTTTIAELDQATISQLVSGLQQAGGATLLPSRDVPINSAEINTDEQVQPNYVPSVPVDTIDYIGEHDTETRVHTQSLDAMYDELQTPLLVAILFFVFQLPAFRKMQNRYAPFLFMGDGNLSLTGFIMNSAAFGAVFYCISRLL